MAGFGWFLVRFLTVTQLRLERTDWEDAFGRELISSPDHAISLTMTAGLLFFLSRLSDSVSFGVVVLMPEVLDLWWGDIIPWCCPSGGDGSIQRLMCDSLTKWTTMLGHQETENLLLLPGALT